jgi:uncharacterized protein (DUF885 family)
VGLLTRVPLFRRVVPFTAYIEGWALYAERIAAEQGWHPTAMDRLGQLVAEDSALIEDALGRQG